MSYDIRTEAGILVGRVDNVVAGMMIKQLNGEWQEKSFKVGGKQLVYVFTDGAAFGNSAMKIQVWEGFYMRKV
ncbi:hypothetical protein PSPHG_CDS_0076 [Pseudomonas phage Psxphi15]